MPFDTVNNSTKKILSWLHTSSLFNSLSTNEMEQIAPLFKQEHFAPNELIVEEGSNSDSMFIISRGIVAVSKKILPSNNRLLAYLMPGDTVGEIGILENAARSATCTTVSETELLKIDRDNFLSLLNKYPTIAIDLARILARYITTMNVRSKRNKENYKVILICDTSQKGSGFAISKQLTTLLGKKENDAQMLVFDGKSFSIFQTSRQHDIHPVYKEKDKNTKQKKSPSSLLAVAIDSMLNATNKLVIYINETINDNYEILQEMINLVVEVSDNKNSFSSSWEDASIVMRFYAKADHPNEFTEIQSGAEQRLSLTETVTSIYERLEKNHRIGIYLPTISESGDAIADKSYIEKAMNFMGDLFGGATGEWCKGVWKSYEFNKLVNEEVYLIRSYTTKSILEEQLNDVIFFVKTLKEDLRQEAMALEINEKLTLI